MIKKDYIYTIQSTHHVIVVISALANHTGVIDCVAPRMHPHLAIRVNVQIANRTSTAAATAMGKKV